MDTEIVKKIVETHHALYRVTDLLPKREPLRKMLRENANTILTYIMGECGMETVENIEFRIRALAKIEVVQNTLIGIKELGYCHPVNFEVLEREYNEIGGYFKKIAQVSNVQGETLNKKEDDFVRVFEGGVAEEVKEEVAQEKQPIVREYEEKSVQNNGFGYNERKQAIVSFIKERKEVRSTELATIFSNRFSLKTLQRDLAELIGQKVIDKQGEKRWAVYRMNGFH